jgi:hypothetical protein
MELELQTFAIENNKDCTNDDSDVVEKSNHKLLYRFHEQDQGFMDIVIETGLHFGFSTK